MLEHLVDFVHLHRPIPLDTLEEDWEALWIGLIVLTTLEQVLPGFLRRIDPAFFDFLFLVFLHFGVD